MTIRIASRIFIGTVFGKCLSRSGSISYIFYASLLLPHSAKQLSEHYILTDISFQISTFFFFDLHSSVSGCIFLYAVISKTSNWMTTKGFHGLSEQKCSKNVRWGSKIIVGAQKSGGNEFSYTPYETTFFGERDVMKIISAWGPRRLEGDGALPSCTGAGAGSVIASFCPHFKGQFLLLVPCECGSGFGRRPG